MIKHDFLFINIRKVPQRLKTSGFALGFQHFSRDLANVNKWKIMFDPSNELCVLLRLNMAVNIIRHDFLGKNASDYDEVVTHRA